MQILFPLHGEIPYSVSAFLTKAGTHCSVNLAFVPVSEECWTVPVFGGGGAGYDRCFSASHLGGL